MSSDGRVLELHKQFAAEQSKYTYFLLAVAASCIALAVRSTRSAVASWSLVPLGFAVVAWSFSFLRGLRFIEGSQQVTRANIDHLLCVQGEHPLTGVDPHKMQHGADAFWQRAETLAAAALQDYQWQFRYLISGGVLYVLWHTLEIALRSRAGA